MAINFMIDEGAGVYLKVNHRVIVISHPPGQVHTFLHNSNMIYSCNIFDYTRGNVFDILRNASCITYICDDTESEFAFTPFDSSYGIRMQMSVVFCLWHHLHRVR